MNDEAERVNNRRPSALPLVDATSKKRLLHEPPLLSSVALAWRGIIVELHRLKPQELPEHYVVGHGLSVNTGQHPVGFGWTDKGRRLEGQINPGAFHLLTHGEHNVPRWLQTFDNVSLVLDRKFVADTVSGDLPADRIEFATQRSATDAIIASYAEAFLSELRTNGDNGLLYVDTLTTGLTLHLLSSYGIAKPRMPIPKAKLNSFQLRTIVDFVQSNLEGDISLVTLAEQVRVSPFHLARQFRATVGVAPHQFVLRQRIQKSIRLIRAGKLPLAQIAVESGFHDQSHLTRSFRKLLGTTPAQYD